MRFRPLGGGGGGSSSTIPAGAVATTPFIVRAVGGVAGTDELQITHDGTDAKLQNMDAGGILTLRALDVVLSTNGNRYVYGVDAVAGLPSFAISITGLWIVNAAQFAWSSNAANAFSGNDTGLRRLAPTVVAPSDGSTGGGWIQDSGAVRMTADLTNATATMANLTDLSRTLIAGRKYIGELTVFASDSTAVEGLKIDFDGGNATATSFVAGISGTPLGATIGVGYSTAIATDLTATTATTADIAYNIPFTIEVNAGGTFIPRFAQVSHATGTATIRKNSYMSLKDCTN